MGTLTGKSRSSDKQTSPFLVIVQKIQDTVNWLNGIFNVSEEDWVNAGVYHGGEGRAE